MTKLNLETAGPIVNTIISSLSKEADTIKIKLNNKRKSVDFYVYDKAFNIELTASFPAEDLDSDKIKYFSIESARLKAIITKRKSIELDLIKNMLNYAYPSEGKAVREVSGKIEIEEYNSTFKFRDYTESDSFINNLVFNYYDKVKLKSIFEEKEMMLYIRYVAADKTLYTSSADNFHISLFTLTKVDLGEKDYDLTLPFKYIDMAKKFASYNNDKIFMHVDDNGYTFSTPLVVFTLPVVSTEGSKINIESILKHYTNVNNKIQVSVTVEAEDIIMFMNNAIAIKEKEKSADISFAINGKTLSYSIETSHGMVQSQTTLKKSFDKHYKIKVSCAALQDLLSRIVGARIKLSIAENNMLLTNEETSTSTLQLTTLGIV